MSEKEYNQQKESKKGKKYRPCKCSQCGKMIDVKLRVENLDFDRINETQISVFCENCDNYEIVKL